MIGIFLLILFDQPINQELDSLPILLLSWLFETALILKRSDLGQVVELLRLSPFEDALAPVTINLVYIRIFEYFADTFIAYAMLIGTQDHR